jgi:hypothetical protein
MLRPNLSKLPRKIYILALSSSRSSSSRSARACMSADSASISSQAVVVGLLLAVKKNGKARRFPLSGNCAINCIVFRTLVKHCRSRISDSSRHLRSPSQLCINKHSSTRYHGLIFVLTIKDRNTVEQLEGSLSTSGLFVWAVSLLLQMTSDPIWNRAKLVASEPKSWLTRRKKIKE